MPKTRLQPRPEAVFQPTALVRALLEVDPPRLGKLISLSVEEFQRYLRELHGTFSVTSQEMAELRRAYVVNLHRLYASRNGGCYDFGIN